MSEYILKIINHPNPKDPINSEKGWGPWDPITRQLFKEEREKERDYEAWLKKHFVEVEWVRGKKRWRKKNGTGIWISKKRRKRE